MDDVTRRFGKMEEPSEMAREVVYALFFLCAFATIAVLSPPVLGDTLGTAALSALLATACLSYVQTNQTEAVRCIDLSFRQVTRFFQLF
jgi:hypothetical protein